MVMRKQSLVEDQANFGVGVMQDGENSDGTGHDAKQFQQRIGLAKGEAFCADPFVQLIKFDLCRAQRTDEDEVSGFVFEEQVLAVSAGQARFDIRALGYGEDGCMLLGVMRNAEPVQQGIKRRFIGVRNDCHSPPLRE